MDKANKLVGDTHFGAPVARKSMWKGQEMPDTAKAPMNVRGTTPGNDRWSKVSTCFTPMMTQVSTVPLDRPKRIARPGDS